VWIAAVFFAVLPESLPAQTQSGPPRFEVGTVIGYVREAQVEEENVFQLGGRFDWIYNRHLGFEAEITHSPFVTLNNGQYSGGHLTQGLFGVKYGERWQHMGMFFKVRPGFNRYSSALGGFQGPSSSLMPTGAPLTIPALNLGVSIEFYLSHHWMISGDAGDTVGWYPRRTVPLGAPGGGTALIPANTTNSFQYSTAISYRFGRQAYAPPVPPSAAEPAASAHPFWDLQNDLLFAGVAVVRALDFESTLNKRSRGVNEGFLDDAIVDNHAEFAAIEVAGTAASIGVSYLFHHYDHHRMERIVSYAHIGAQIAAIGANYAARGCPVSQRDARGNCP
jgi:hypothetical protein